MRGIIHERCSWISSKWKSSGRMPPDALLAMARAQGAGIKSADRRDHFLDHS